MQQQIESIILSNVGNRLTQELAHGIILGVLQVAQQATNDATAAVRAALTEMPDEPLLDFAGSAGAQASAGSSPLDHVDPAYRAPAASAPPPAAKTPRRPKATATKKARQ